MHCSSSTLFIVTNCKTIYHQWLYHSYCFDWWYHDIITCSISFSLRFIYLRSLNFNPSNMFLFCTCIALDHTRRKTLQSQTACLHFYWFLYLDTFIRTVIQILDVPRRVRTIKCLHNSDRKWSHRQTFSQRIGSDQITRSDGRKGLVITSKL